jgi:hypothetical protein
VIEFRTSSFCDAGGCVEVGRGADGSFTVRDTKDPGRRDTLRFTTQEWDAFVKGVKAGEFDPA